MHAAYKQEIVITNNPVVPESFFQSLIEWYFSYNKYTRIYKRQTYAE